MIAESRLIALLAVLTVACAADSAAPAETDTTAEDASTSTVGSSTGGETGSGTVGEEASGSTGAPLPGPLCRGDEDRDLWPHESDNAEDHYNPSQLDRDDDDLGDVADLCVFDGRDPNNTADRDDDGVGNACDRCRSTLNDYNWHASDAGVPESFWVRNNPVQTDSDGDGVADPCDNCVAVPNCQGFGADTDPFEIGDLLEYDAEDCQEDANEDMVGDACEGTMAHDYAAGPVGFERGSSRPTTSTRMG